MKPQLVSKHIRLLLSLSILLSPLQAVAQNLSESAPMLPAVGDGANPAPPPADVLPPEQFRAISGGCAIEELRIELNYIRSSYFSEIQALTHDMARVQREMESRGWLGSFSDAVGYGSGSNNPWQQQIRFFRSRQATLAYIANTVLAEAERRLVMMERNGYVLSLASGVLANINAARRVKGAPELSFSCRIQPVADSGSRPRALFVGNADWAVNNEALEVSRDLIINSVLTVATLGTGLAVAARYGVTAAQAGVWTRLFQGALVGCIQSGGTSLIESLTNDPIRDETSLARHVVNGCGFGAGFGFAIGGAFEFVRVVIGAIGNEIFIAMVRRETCRIHAGIVASGC